MKNYIKLLTDDEIKSYILSYLKLTNWRDDKNDINKIEDIVVKRNNNEVTITLYFKHFLKSDIHDEHVTEHSDLYGFTLVKVYQSFYGDSYTISGYGLYDNQVRKFLFTKNKDIKDDLNKYWNYKLYKKFGEKYLADLKKYKTQILQKKYKQEEIKIDKHIKSITEELEM